MDTIGLIRVSLGSRIGKSRTVSGPCGSGNITTLNSIIVLTAKVVESLQLCVLKRKLGCNDATSSSYVQSCNNIMPSRIKLGTVFQSSGTCGVSCRKTSLYFRKKEFRGFQKRK
eukprot:Pgem_evm2s19941